MSETILLRCTKCRREMTVDRQEDFDPPHAACVETICDRCDDGDFSETFHYDADGKHIVEPW